jgi:hypothetical protein
MMIRLENGSYVNSDTIRVMSRKGGWGKDTRTLLYPTSNEFNCYTAKVDVDELAGAVNTHVIQAMPGYELVLSSCEAEDEFSFFRCPIIAWRVRPNDGTPSPITVNGDEGASNPQVILRPDGAVEDQPAEDQFIRTYDNLEAWEKDAREKWAKDRAARLAKEATEAAE